MLRSMLSIVLLLLAGCQGLPTRRNVLYLDGADTAASLQLAWSAESGERFILEDRSHRFVAYSGMRRMLVDGNWVELNDPVVVRSGRALLPASMVGEIAGRLRRAPHDEPPVESRPSHQVEHPSRGNAAPARNIAITLPAAIETNKTRKWSYIVIHHSDTDNGNAAIFDRYHHDVRKWKNGLGYHFVIGNGTDSGDGEIEVGPRWRKQIQGAHAGNNTYNEQGIGICMVGNFDKYRPSERQLEALRALCRLLMRRYKIRKRDVIGHGAVPGKVTNCPGSRFDLAGFRRGL